MAKLLQVTHSGASSREAMQSIHAFDSSEALVLVLATPQEPRERGDRVYRIVQERIERAFHELPMDNPRKFLTRAFGDLNAALFSAGSGGTDDERLLASIACVFVAGGQVTTAHIGDARIYLLRDGLIKAVTQDHTQAQQMVDQALLKPQEARTHPLARVVLRILGKKPVIDVPVQGPAPARKGDVYILCSAGLVRLVDDHTIGNAIAAGDLSTACAELSRKAEAAIGLSEDAVSLQAVRFGDSSLKKVVAYNPLDNITRSLMSREGRVDESVITSRGWWIRALLGAAMMIYILFFAIFDPHLGASARTRGPEAAVSTKAPAAARGASSLPTGAAKGDAEESPKTDQKDLP